MSRAGGELQQPFAAPALRRTMRWLCWPVARGGIARLLLLLCVGQVLLWGIAVGLSYRAPDVDSAEQFVWGSSLQLGYLKHPPLPSWIMYALLRLFGPSMALPAVAAQACIVIALVLSWRLGCEFMSPRRSLIATLLTSLVTYYNIGGDSFNHTTVLLPLQAATWLFFYLATRRGGWWRWALGGLFAGLAMLVKYTMLAPLAGMLVYFVLDRRLHRWRALLGALLAALVFALVLLPHVLWLVSHDFMPLHYAQQVAEKLPDAPSSPLATAADFLWTQLQRMVPFLLALWFVFARDARWRAKLPQPAAAAAQAPALSREDWWFLWLAALAPLSIVLAIGLFAGTALAARWGANGFLLIGHLALLLSGRPDSWRMLRQTVRIVVLVQVLLCAGQTLGKTVIAGWLGRANRINFPGALLTREAEQTWQRHTHTPLHLVASDSWLGGNLIAHSAPGLKIMIDGLQSASPWVTPAQIDACGILVLQQIGRGVHNGPPRPQPGIDALFARAEAQGVWTLPWVGAHWRAPAHGSVRWGIVPARPGLRCLDRGGA